MFRLVKSRKNRTNAKRLPRNRKVRPISRTLWHRVRLIARKTFRLVLVAMSRLHVSRMVRLTRLRLISRRPSLEALNRTNAEKRSRENQSKRRISRLKPTHVLKDTWIISWPTLYSLRTIGIRVLLVSSLQYALRPKNIRLTCRRHNLVDVENIRWRLTTK